VVDAPESHFRPVPGCSCSGWGRRRRFVGRRAFPRETDRSWSKRSSRRLLAHPRRAGLPCRRALPHGRLAAGSIFRPSVVVPSIAESRPALRTHVRSVLKQVSMRRGPQSQRAPARSAARLPQPFGGGPSALRPGLAAGLPFS
jgi:hypothetical protein